MKKNLLRLTCFVLIFAALLTTITFAYAYMGNGKWSTSSVNYAIATNVPTDYISPIENAAAWWTDNTEFTLTRNSSSKINVYVYDYGFNGWDGISYMTPSDWDSTFQYGNIQLNHWYLNNYTDIQKQTIAAHEFGHEIGLAHTISIDLMYKSLSSIWDNNPDVLDGPSEYDINAVNSLY